MPEIVFAHHFKDHVPGDRVDVAAPLAKRLVRAGKANYAAKPDATAAEGPAGEARTVAAVAETTRPPRPKSRPAARQTRG